jgi:hypothetical protein
MIDLYRFFINPFDDEGISVEELTDYSVAHLAALTANNPGGQFNLLIAATDTLHTALGGKVSTETVQLGIQMARTQAKNDFRAALPNEISKLQGAALAKYGRKGAVMLEIFPGGADAFGAAADPELGGLLDALATAVGNRAGELGADPKTQALALAAAWASLYGAAASGKAGKGSAATARRDAVKALRLQLFQNMLSLASAFPNQQAKANLYCPQHLLENPQPTKKPAAGTTPAK